MDVMGTHQTIEGNHLNRLPPLTLRSAHPGTILESDKSHRGFLAPQIDLRLRAALMAVTP